MEFFRMDLPCLKKKGPMVGHLFGLPFSHYVNIFLIQSGTSLE